MAHYTGVELGKELCEAVGVNPENINRIIVDCRIGAAAVVITHGFADTDIEKVSELKKEIKKYKLVLLVNK